MTGGRVTGAEFALAVTIDLVGAGGALVVSQRAWQTVVTPRPAPLPADVLELSGRALDSAPTAMALVALAGVVAVLATRGPARRVVGGVVLLAGLGLGWRSVSSAGAVGTARARALVAQTHPTVSVDAVVPRVIAHQPWPALSVACAVVVVAAGALIMCRGHRWRVMSARYDSSTSAASEAGSGVPGRAATALWSALDRGEDPTS